MILNQFNPVHTLTFPQHTLIIVFPSISWSHTCLFITVSPPKFCIPLFFPPLSYISSHNQLFDFTTLIPGSQHTSNSSSLCNILNGPLPSYIQIFSLFPNTCNLFSSLRIRYCSQPQKERYNYVRATFLMPS